MFARSGDCERKWSRAGPNVLLVTPKSVLMVAERGFPDLIWNMYRTKTFMLLLSKNRSKQDKIINKTAPALVGQ